MESQIIPANSMFCFSPIQGQKQNSQQVSSCVKRNRRKTSAKSPELMTPPDTPSAISLDDGNLKNSEQNSVFLLFCIVTLINA